LFPCGLVGEVEGPGQVLGHTKISFKLTSGRSGREDEKFITAQAAFVEKIGAAVLSWIGRQNNSDAIGGAGNNS